MMVVEFTAEGPAARAVLTYGQPDDASDPNHSSQMQVYASGGLRPVLFRQDDIAADVEATTIEVLGPRS